MPPSSSMRRQPPANATVDSNPIRRASGRAVRTNTARPANYYARPSAGFAATAGDDGSGDNAPPGFFPAIQYFTDAISALPKEVMRQFTLMKEVEAKIHGPTEKLGEMLDGLLELPVPQRKLANAPGEVGVPAQGMLSFTANNSMNGSARASLINGVAPNAGQISANNSARGSVTGEEVPAQDAEEELAKRRRFHELRVLAHDMLANLDEKNVVLAEANRVLSMQLSRVDSVMPHVEGEISEEARLGSMTHWAYTDNRQKKPTGNATTERNRRDVAATNSLAAAASAIHETEIMQARRDATRETAREKQGKRTKEHLDSDFDDKPRKGGAKGAKGKGATQATAAGLGISTNGEPVKRRKLDKTAAAPAMARTTSGAGKGTKAAKETPRSTPAVEPVKKTAKAKPGPGPTKRKGIVSAQNSPALASSPLASSFATATAMEPPPTSGRLQSTRLRQNSAASNLAHSRLAEEATSRPPSAGGKANGNMEKAQSKKKTQGNVHDKADQAVRDAENASAKATTERDPMKEEEADNERPSMPSRSNSSKVGHRSNAGTPRIDGPAELLRTRSAKSLRNDPDSSSSEPQAQGVGGSSKHRRNGHGSYSHLVKQLAPFNRSPDLDRHRSKEGDEDDTNDDLESLDSAERNFDGERLERPSRSRPSSARRRTNPSPPPSSPEQEERPRSQRQSRPQTANEEAGRPMPSSRPESPDPDQDEDQEQDQDQDQEMPNASPTPDHNDSTIEQLPDAEDEVSGADSEHDPDDPSEPRYCYCQRVSWGQMIACDNDDCEKEWFHIDCTGLEVAPDDVEKWYCTDCRPLFVKTGRGKKGRGSTK